MDTAEKAYDPGPVLSAPKGSLPGDYMPGEAPPEALARRDEILLERFEADACCPAGDPEWDGGFDG